MPHEVFECEGCWVLFRIPHQIRDLENLQCGPALGSLFLFSVEPPHGSEVPLCHLANLCGGQAQELSRRDQL